MTPEEEVRFLALVQAQCRETAPRRPSGSEDPKESSEQTITSGKEPFSDLLWQRSELLKLVLVKKDREEELQLQAQNLLEMLKLTRACESVENGQLRQALVNALHCLEHSVTDTLALRRARHEPLLKRLKPMEEVDILTLLNSSREELEARVLIQRDWLAHYAACLDGLNLKAYKDGRRLPADIRSEVKALLS